MNINIKEEHRKLTKALAANKNAKRAEGEKKYLKSPWLFYGVEMSARKKIVNQWFKDHPKIGIHEVEKLARNLWESNWHEEKSLAIMLLERLAKQLTLKQMALVEKMINTATGWDHLDEISAHLVGAMLENDPKTIRFLPKWANSKNFWVRRASLLSQILFFRKGKGDPKLFFRLAVPMFNERKDWSKEERFFIRKAIGWTLRELCKSKPEQVFKFIKKYKQRMSGLTLREGSRKLPGKMQSHLWQD